jgi:hypothetical protein
MLKRLVISLLLIGLGILGGFWMGAHHSRREATKFETAYQAVLLDNGQVYYGKLERARSEYPVLTDVYYVQNQVNPQTKEVTNILVRRGNEWHAPDRMYLNARHIVLIEPVGANSKVAQLIAETKH